MCVVKLDGQYAFVRLQIDPVEIPGLLLRHADQYPGAGSLESTAAALVEADFAPSDSSQFVQQVCKWGGGHRLVGRVIQLNTPEQIAAALRAGNSYALGGEVAKGVDAISQLRFLGQSFASKQLRFLAPTKAVILDEVIRSALGYANNGAGYSAFLRDCKTLLGLATRDGIVHGNGKPLRIADVEAAVFAKIQKY
jgi:hypothetical protein